jgi:hypothetical protein
VTGEDCKRYGQPCTSVGDCTATSCCVVLDLDVIDSNHPGRSLPEASIEPCGPDAKLYCIGVCGRSHPDWGEFNDLL